MNTLEMIGKALNEVVEQKVAEMTAKPSLDSVLEFIKNSTEEDRMAIIDCFIANHQETLDEYYERRLEDDDSIINKDDIDVQTVCDCDLLEDCFNEYLDDAYNLREIAKDIIDRI